MLIAWIVKGMQVKYLTFMGPCIANKFQYISNKMQLYTVHSYLENAVHVWVVPPPTIRSACSSIYSI